MFTYDMIKSKIKVIVYKLLGRGGKIGAFKGDEYWIFKPDVKGCEIEGCGRRCMRI